MTIHLKNASRHTIAEAFKVRRTTGSYYEITRRNIANHNINLGRSFTPMEVNWFRARLAQEQGYVTWPKWREILREFDQWKKG